MINNISIHNLTIENLAELVSTAGAEFITDRYGRNCYLYGAWVSADEDITQNRKYSDNDEHFTVLIPTSEIYAELNINEEDDENGDAIFSSENFEYQWFTEAVKTLFNDIMEYITNEFGN